jgi:hypothetical protein
VANTVDKETLRKELKEAFRLFDKEARNKKEAFLWQKKYSFGSNFGPKKDNFRHKKYSFAKKCNFDKKIVI